MIKPTIYEVLRDKLGREPTNAELSPMAFFLERPRSR